MAQSRMDNPEKLATLVIQDTRRRQTKQVTTTTVCAWPHYTQTDTNNVNKTWALLQTTGSNDEPNIVLCESMHRDSALKCTCISV